MDRKDNRELPYQDSSELPYSNKFKDTKSFYYRAIYELGCGYRTIIFYKTKDHICYYLEDYTGETVKKKSASRVIHYRKINLNKFDKFISILVSKNIMSLKVNEARRLSNYHIVDRCV